MCNCCKCFFSCWEDFYWNCIEEKFCFDETLVSYDPEEDEKVVKNKSKNGYYSGPTADGDSAENNNAPICRQPAGSIGRNMSMSSACKIHEDDLRREIQTNVPMLAPEVMAIFANSQIFQSNAPSKQQQTSKATSPSSVKFAISDSGSPIDVTTPAAAATAEVGAGDDGRSESSDKLLKRLEGTSLGERDNRAVIPAIVEEEDIDGGSERDDEVILRPPRVFSDAALSKSIPRDVGSSMVHKQISYLQAEVPYFAIRPASENDIFTISSSVGGGGGGGGSGGSGTYNAISMTPEVPAISYSNLPKNYLETPVIEKYRESVSLYSIQTAGINRQSQTDDLSMPRYYGKSELFVVGIDRAGSRSADAVEMGRSDDGSSGTLAKNQRARTNMEKSKRLMNIRTALPPLNLGLVRGHSSANLRERDRDSKERDRHSKSKESMRV
ncbi:uncharacterized protein LOC131209486 [Anopheles bellator]|uniref:uncharacterized protein LOC131209486 n=1 Tax=Anopheles bellator TaxID=139047 RepID=UPI0026477D66|nr:uncharacterized protein LOC131209486 [Anopheles bellator]XP_058058548.1 uncharacterized protein LOC131209486 [Anopheles bellator]XP_058058549.1 uncharacterized protein LOC131209486 [Anopheles bellator]